MKISNGEKRDWSLLIFIVPVGIFLMMIAGQIAIRIIPNWSVYAGMQSSLDPQTASKQQAEVQPILPGILTPLSWFDTFLTPNANSDGNVVFPPFIVFEASSTPSPSPTPSTTTTVTVTTTSTATLTPTPATFTATPTKKPTETQEETPTPPAVCTDPAANNVGDPLPCTYPPPVCTDPAANNVGDPLPCTYPPPVCTDPAANNVGDPLPCTYPPPVCTDPAANNIGELLPCTYYVPVSSPLVGAPTPVPSGIDVGAPNGTLGTIPDGYYVLLDLSSSPIYVNGPSDTDYDFVYYEEGSGNGILMDTVILSISSDGITYYVVFNWGDGIPDTNSNVGDVTSSTGTENDNQLIDNPTDTGELYGTDPLDTGILVDVDSAPDQPPIGTYVWLAIQAPSPPTSTDGLVVNSVEVTEVPVTP